MPINYRLKPDETIKEYKNRVSEARGEELNSDILAPKNDKFNAFDDTLRTDVGNIEIPKIEMTQPEEKTQDLTEQLRELSGQLTGQSELRGNLREEKGVGQMEKDVQELSSRLSAIQKEGQAIPLEIQQESIGRGRTRGGVEPLEMARKRENTIDALRVSSLLEAKRGNLSLAYDQIDRSVKEKYDPIREEINAVQSNLQIIKESPQYTIAEKNRATRRQALLDQREKEVAEQEEMERQIQNIAVQAATKGVDNITLDKIRNAGSVVEATQIAQEAGVFTEEVEQRDVSGLVRAVQSGQMNITNVPSEFRAQVSNQVDFGQIPTGETPDDDSDITINLTPEDQRTLTGAGFKREEISDLIRSVNDFGVSAVIEELDDPKKIQAVKDIYNIEPDFDVQSAADRLIASKIEKKFWPSRSDELQDAIDSILQQIEDFGIEGISEEQQEDIRRAIQEKQVTRDEAKRILRLKEQLK